MFGRLLRPIVRAGTTLPAGATAWPVSTGATLAVGTTGSSRPALSAGARSEIFFTRQLSIAILVELLQRGGRVGDFISVNHAIVIRVEGCDDGRRLAHSSRSAGTTATTLATRAALTFFSRSAFPGRWAVLGDEQRRGDEAQA